MSEPSELSDLELLARLVAFDSTSCYSNLPIADFIADYLDRPGIRVERNPSADGDKTNLIVTVGPQTDAQSRDGLVLSGHMDVVPATEPEWQSDPFTMVDAGDRVVGRGCCDMKGFVALAINRALRTADSAATSSLAAPLCLVLTFDEEVGTLGAHHFANTWPSGRPLPRRALIGEPTSLQAVRMHKGHAKLRLVTHGTPAHSGYPHLGNNAIEPMGRAIVALAELRRQLEDERSEHAVHFPEVPFVPLNLAQIDGGRAMNIVPDRCQMVIGYRVLPGVRAADIAKRVEQAVDGALEGCRYDLDNFAESPPMLLAADNDLYLETCRLIDQDETVSASYATDAGWFDQAGYDCMLWGPGDIGVAHKPNEWLPKDEFARAGDGLDHLIAQFCRQNSGQNNGQNSTRSS